MSKNIVESLLSSKFNEKSLVAFRKNAQVRKASSGSSGAKSSTPKVSFDGSAVNRMDVDARLESSAVNSLDQSVNSERNLKGGHVYDETHKSLPTRKCGAVHCRGKFYDMQNCLICYSTLRVPNKNFLCHFCQQPSRSLFPYEGVPYEMIASVTRFFDDLFSAIESLRHEHYFLHILTERKNVYRKHAYVQFFILFKTCIL